MDEIGPKVLSPLSIMIRIKCLWTSECMGFHAFIIDIELVSVFSHPEGIRLEDL